MALALSYDPSQIPAGLLGPLQQQAGVKPPQPITPQSLQPQGLLGNIGNAIGGFARNLMTPMGLRALGSVAYDIGHGTNTTPDLLARMQEQQMQLMQYAWLRQQQQRQQTLWGREDQQYQAQQNLANNVADPNAPPDYQDLVRADPNAYAGALIQRMMHPPMQPLTPSASDQLGIHLRAGTSAQYDPITHHVEVVQAPYVPPVSLQIANGASDNMVDMAASSLLQTGNLPAWLANRNPALIARIAERATQMGAQQGMSNSDIANRIAGASATTRANQVALNTTARTTANIAPAERAAQDALSQVEYYSGLVRRTGSPALNMPINRWNEQMNGDPNLSAFRTAALSFGSEYARVLAQNGVSTDAAREHANSMFNPNLTPAQIMANAQVARADMAYRTHEQQAQGQAIVNSGVGNITQQPGNFTAQTPYGQRPQVPREGSAAPPARPSAAPQAQSAPVRVATPADAARLAPGTRYQTPDGRIFIR